MPAKRPKAKPQRVVSYGILCLLLRPYLRVAYHFHRPRQFPPLPLGPVVLLANHASNLDFLYAVATLWPKRFNIVVSSYFFNDVRLARLFRFFRCIQREQFRSDVASIADMRSVIAQGGSLLIYPEGEVNGIGRGDPAPESIARLCKLLGVPVYAIRTYGGYMTRPKWNPKIRRGKVEAVVEPVATGEEAASLSQDALYQLISRAIFVDEYEWQRNAMAPFPLKNPAEGLEDLLYLCPRCGAEYATRTEGNQLFCTACGNRGVMDVFGFLSPAGSDCAIPETVPEWVELQRQALRWEISREDFCLKADTYLQFHFDSRSVLHTDVGEGVVSLTRQSLSYTGSCQGEQVNLCFPAASIYKLPFSMGKQFDVPNSERLISMRLKNGQMVEKFVLAMPLVYEMTKNTP